MRRSSPLGAKIRSVVVKENDMRCLPSYFSRTVPGSVMGLVEATVEAVEVAAYPSLAIYEDSATLQANSFSTPTTRI